MAFDLAKAAGLEKMVSNLDTIEIQQIPVDLLDENENNFFAVDDVQDLKDSIAVNGILQPLLVVPADGRYRLIAGHRRRKAAMELAAEGNSKFSTVPCVVLPKMSAAMEETVLIQTNSTSRELSYAERLEAVKRLKQTLVQLKQEGVKLPGKLRDIVAEQLEISRTEVARMEVIDKRLIPAGKEKLAAKELSPSAAYAIARADPAVQQEVLDLDMARRGAHVIEEFIAARAHDWLERDCPEPDGFWQHEEKRKGNLLQCPFWRRIEQHKAKGHPESCCGCCSKCSLYANGYHCPDVCPNVKAHASARQADEARRLQEADIAARKQAAKEHFKTTPFANIEKVLGPLLEQGGQTADDLAEAWGFQLGELDGEHASDFDGGDVSSLIHPETLDDVNYDLVAFVAFCNTVDKTPDELLGYRQVTSAAAAAGWIRFDEQQPPDGARVTARRRSAGLTLVGEYLYRDGKWYSPELDGFEMNVTNVTHWILAPEV